MGTYRKEIDGLRGLACLMVMLYHAGFETFSGGFIGIDVFLVISGFVITNTILHDQSQKRFRLGRFYEKRVRRLAPAILLVMLVCIPFAYLWMFPEPLKDFASSIASVLLSLSNVWFWQQSDYFAPAVETMPLLHSWSIAVEIQFYVFYPLLLLLIWRFASKHVFTLVALITLLSFAGMAAASYLAPVANYYLTPVRGWQLLAGCLAAIWMQRHPVTPNSALAIVGLASLIAGTFLLDSSIAWPSLWTLVPVVGTLLILLYAAPNNASYHLLCVSPLVGAGLISYSLYLWHYPIFAFARIHSIHTLSDGFMLGLIALSIVLATLSYVAVEKPFRYHASRTQLYSCCGAAMLLLAGFVTAAHFTNGLEQRYSTNIITMLQEATVVKRPTPCDYHTAKDVFSFPDASCRHGPEDGAEIAIIGDSHARTLALNHYKTLSSHGIRAYHSTMGGCLPVANLQHTHSDNAESCLDYNDAWNTWFASDGSPDMVALMGRWTFVYDGERFQNQEGGREYGKVAFSDVVGPSTSPYRKERLLDAYRKQIEQLLALGKHVILIYPVPEAGWDVPRIGIRQQVMNPNHPIDITTSLDVFYERNRDVLDLFDRITHPNLHRIRPHKLLCNDQTRRCVNAKGDTLYYVDDDHLSAEGAILIEREIARIASSLRAQGVLP